MVISPRDGQIYRDYRSGIPMKRIAIINSISKARVSQIIARINDKVPAWSDACQEDIYRETEEAYGKLFQFEMANNRNCDKEQRETLMIYLEHMRPKLKAWSDRLISTKGEIDRKIRLQRWKEEWPGIQRQHENILGFLYAQ